MSKVSTFSVRRCQVYLQKNSVTILACVLLCAAASFFVQAQQIRATTRYSNPEAFEDGDIVTVIEIVDGDDVMIERRDGTKTRLRLLGIDAFGATVSDPLLLEYGRICMQYLSARSKGKPARLSVSAKRIGDKGRLLGALFLADASEEFTLDIGLELVRKGYALAYTRYAFESEIEYLSGEAHARRDKSGFWSDPVVSSRAAALKRLWDAERGAHD
jgi:endonuclease YncB( thermonuclease family)